MDFVEHLREPSVDPRDPAEDSFVTSEMPKIRSRVDEITYGEEKEKNGKRTENDFLGDISRNVPTNMSAANKPHMKRPAPMAVSLENAAHPSFASTISAASHGASQLAETNTAMQSQRRPAQNS
jgi:hypothetical protein